MLGLDVQNTLTNGAIMMTTFWYVVLMSSLIYLTLILPSGLFFSETEEEDKIVSNSKFI